MWIIVNSDDEFDEDCANILMGEDGAALKFKDKTSAYRYLQSMCKEHGLDYDLMEGDIELCRLH